MFVMGVIISYDLFLVPQGNERPKPGGSGHGGNPVALGIQHLTHLVETLQIRVDCIACQLEAIERAVNAIPTRADLDAAKAQLQQGITDATNRVVTDLQALRDQIAAGNPVTDQDIADIQADVAAVANIDVAPTPAPAP
jgi:hypothetical protein